MSVKKLASQTLVYGLTNIVGKLLNYLLIPYYTHLFSPVQNAPIQIVFAWIPFLNVLFTYGMETAFFRFSKEDNDKRKVLSTTSISLLVSTVLFTIAILLCRNSLAQLMKIDNILYLIITAFILFFDTLSTIPFANLRLQNKPARYGLLKITNILLNVGLNLFFLTLCPILYKNGFTAINFFYDPSFGVGYIFLAQLIANCITWLFLIPDFISIKWTFDKQLWQKIMLYSMPLIVVGLAGMVNETLDRAFFLPHFLPFDDETKKLHEIGVYGNCYKLSILITLIIQAFRMGAEPFFFAQAGSKNDRHTYARIMKYFVMLLCVMFLCVAMYINVWKELLRNHEYWQGLKVVVPLLIANIFLGVYYNLTIWFKLTNQTIIGAKITVITAVLAFILNILLIPIWGYMGSAIATMICYGVQMALCYVWGQQHFPIPYAVKKLTNIFLLALFFYCVFWAVVHFFISPTDIYVLNFATISVATILLCTYIFILYKIEKPYLTNMHIPIIGKYFKS